MYRVIVICVSLFIFVLSGNAQKRELDKAAYQSWRRVDDYQLSSNGAWVKYRYMFYDNDSMNNVVCNTHYFYDVKTGRTCVLESLDSPEFFAGGEWIAYSKEGEGNHVCRIARRLRDGYEIVIPDEAELNYFIPRVAYKAGDRLIVRDVVKNDSVVLTNVACYCLYGKDWNVIYTSKEREEHVLYYGTLFPNGVKKILYRDKTKSLENFYFYEREEEGEFYVHADAGEEEGEDYYRFSLSDGKVVKVLEHEQMKRLNMDRYSIRLLDGGKKLVYQEKIGAREKKKEKKKDDSFQLELWSWHDPMIPSEQARSGFREPQVVPVRYLYDCESGRHYELCGENHSELYVPRGGNASFAYEQDETLYANQRDWRHDQRFDLYLVDLQSGKHRLVERTLTQTVQWSPKGDYLLYFENNSRSWVILNPQTMDKRILAEEIPYPLYDELHDRPNPPAPYGLAGWSEDGRYAIIYDRFDIWVVHLEKAGKTYCWTKGEGRRRNISLRLLDPGRNGLAVSLNSENRISTFDWGSKNGGLSGLSAKGKLTPLVEGNFAFSVIQESKDGNVVLGMKQSYQLDRDLWVCNRDGRRMKKITDVNPQQGLYRWGTAEQVEWTNYDGVLNQGVLYLPDDYDRNKSYPTIVSFYETHTPEIHVHPVPGLSQAMIDIPTYVSKGYIVFQPDVYIQIGRPGESAYNAVVSGTRALIDRGIIDSCRVGLQGHSWSGFLVAYLITRTDMFKCVNIGAANVNLTSVYTALREGSGQPNMFMFEDWQCRMGTTLWENLEGYIANSSLLFADRIHTPALILHCDQDEAVSFYDGRNLFLALRRLQRPVWMLNYMGQGHFLTSRPAEVDWTLRMEQFFNHYLKDAPMPRWMKEGINIHERGVDQKYDLE